MKRTIQLTIDTRSLAMAVWMLATLWLLLFLPKRALTVETWQTEETATIPFHDDPTLIIQFEINRVFDTAEPQLMSRGNHRLVSCSIFLTLTKDEVELARLPINTPESHTDRLSLTDIEAKLKNHETRGDITAAISAFTGIFRPHTPMLDDGQKGTLQAAYGMYPQPFPYQIKSQQSLGKVRVPGFWKLEARILLLSVFGYFIIYMIFRESSQKPVNEKSTSVSARSSIH